MAYHSILFVQKTPEEINQDADFLKDLNINQIIKATLGGEGRVQVRIFLPYAIRKYRGHPVSSGDCQGAGESGAVPVLCSIWKQNAGYKKDNC